MATMDEQGKMEEQMALRIEELARKSVYIPRIFRFILSDHEEEGQLVDIMFINDHSNVKHLLQRQAMVQKFIIKQGGEWNFSEGYPHFDANVSNLCATLSLPTATVDAFNLTGDIKGIEKIENMLGDLIENLEYRVRRTPVPRVVLMCLSTNECPVSIGAGMRAWIMVTEHMFLAWILSDDLALETTDEKAMRIAYMENMDPEFTPHKSFEAQLELKRRMQNKSPIFDPVVEVKKEVK